MDMLNIILDVRRKCKNENRVLEIQKVDPTQVLSLKKRKQVLSFSANCFRFFIFSLPEFSSMSIFQFFFSSLPP